MSLSVKVSTKHQIVVPSEARRRLGVAAGDRLDVEITDDEIVLRKRPAKAADRLWGIARGMYEPDPVTFVRELRDELEGNARGREEMVDHDAGHGASQDRARRERADLRPRGSEARRPRGASPDRRD